MLIEPTDSVKSVGQSNFKGKNSLEKTEKLTLRDLYAKKQYKNIVMRLEEDSSSMWFDHLEQELCEYREICHKYDQITQHLPWVQSIKAQHDEEFMKIV